METIVLLSHILDQNTPTYGNRDRFTIEEISQISDGATANSSKWTFSNNHLGTHIDMPKHFFENGDTLNDIPLDLLFSDKIQLIDIQCLGAKLIKLDDLTEKITFGTEILLIKTGYEKFRKTDKYWNDNPGLSPSLGIWLRKNRQNIKMIGFDFISLSSWKFREIGKKAHKAFLDPKGKNSPILLIEDMCLSRIKKRVSKMFIAPLLVDKSNGSPVTVIAVIDK